MALESLVEVTLAQPLFECVAAGVLVNIYQWQMVVEVLIAGGLPCPWRSCEEEGYWFDVLHRNFTTVSIVILTHILFRYLEKTL
jgi:hypothetical protein